MASAHTGIHHTDVQIKGYECPFVTESLKTPPYKADLISILWLPLRAPPPRSAPTTQRTAVRMWGRCVEWGQLSLVSARQEVAQRGIVLLVSGMHKQVQEHTAFRILSSK